MAGPSIPASQIVSITPGVISAGGSALDLLGMVLTQNTRVPIGTVASFPTYASVAAFFGPTSAEAAVASTYFLGSTNATKAPGAIMFYQANLLAVSAYLRGASIASMPLATLQAITGALNVTIDGGAFAITNLNLSAATSPSSAASLIQTALAAVIPSEAAGTGSISGTIFTASAPSSGAYAVGQVLSGTGVSAGTTITALGTGTGAAGTYTVSPTQTVASTTITASAAAPVVTYDSVSGGIVITSGSTGSNSTIAVATGSAATSLMLTAAKGAVTSQGAPAGNYTTQMATLLTLTTNWAGFMTVTEQTLTAKLVLAAWANSTNNRYFYAMHDSLSATATQTGDTTSAGAQCVAAGYQGVVPIWAPVNGALAAAALLGCVASIDFSAINGRTDGAFQSSAGLPADVTNATVASNLDTNGYNFFGAYATANQQFTFFYPGSIVGKFNWIDSFVDQVWLNNQLQLALVGFLTTIKSVPYNPTGYAMIEEVIKGPAEAALSFGAIRTGGVLSPTEIAAVNAATNVNAATTISTQGYYILVSDPGAQVRAVRGSPLCLLFYFDGGSVQAINLSSVDVQ